MIRPMITAAGVGVATVGEALRHTEAVAGPERESRRARGCAGDHPAATASVAPTQGPPAWIPLTVAGPGTTTEPRPLRTGRLLAQIGIAALAIVALVAFLGSIASRNIAEREAINDAAQRTDLLADAIVTPVLDDGLLALAPASIAALDRVVRDHVLADAVVRVKLWTPDGLIVYSDEPRLIGETFALDAEEQEVLVEPMTRAEVSDLERPENRFESGRERLLEVYRPVWTPGGEPLLLEIYAPYDTVTARAGELWRGFAGITLTSMLLLVVLLLPVLWRLTDRLRRAQTQREVLLQRAVDASAEERRRIASSLHDGVVQDLAASSFAVAGVVSRVEDLGQPVLAGQLRAVHSTVRASIAGLRSLLVDIYPASLGESGLCAALEDAAASLRSRGIHVAIDVPGDGSTGLDPAGEQLVFRLAQECLRNTARHAAAERVSLTLGRTGGAVVLTIVDDGVGFEPSKVLAQPQEGHFGVRILADLASSAGAVLEVASAPGRGTRWRMTLAAA